MMIVKNHNGYVIAKPERGGKSQIKTVDISIVNAQRKTSVILQIIDKPKISERLFECEDVFYCILEHLKRYKYFKRLRLVCQKALQAFEAYHPQTPIGKFWNTTITPINIFNLINNIEDNHYLTFISKFNLNNKLTLDKYDIKFINNNLYSDHTTSNEMYIKRTQFIEIIKFLRFPSELNQTLIECLQNITKNPIAFTNFKKLITHKVAHLPNGLSIESFESRGKNKEVNLCNLQKLKTIKLGSVSRLSRFYLKNLPSLESITIRKLSNIIVIKHKEVPNLQFITINGNITFFDKSKLNEGSSIIITPYTSYYYSSIT